MIELDIYNLRLADFVYRFNKTRQTLSDVILQGDGVAVIPALAKKICLVPRRQLTSKVHHVTLLSQPFVVDVWDRVIIF